MYLARKPLDHYYAELRDKSLAVVSGNWHTNFCLVGYVKYKPSNRPSQWSKNGIFYERLVKVYSAQAVREHTAWSLYVPFFDTDVPCIPVREIAALLDPVARSIELLSVVKDDLEKIALEMLLDISSSTGVIPGVTGSILPGIHNPLLSDVDLVVYGSAESRRVVEYLEENKGTYEPFSEERLKTWAQNIALSTGLTMREAMMFYRNWRRGVYRGREYSVVFNDGVYRDVLLLPGFKSIGLVEVIAEISGDLSALNYPSRARVLSYRVVKSPVKVPYDLTEVISYEALYTTGLYEGGFFEIRGLLQCSEYLNTCRVLVGVREYESTMRYYKG